MSTLENRLRALSPEQRQQLMDKLQSGKPRAATPAPQQAPIIAHPSIDGRYPLSSSQSRLWFLEQLNPELATYHMATAFRIKGHIHAEILQEALNILGKRHRILSAAFIEDRQGVHQVIRDTQPILLHTRTLPEKHLQQALLDEANRPFDLSSPPLCRVSLFTLADKTAALSLTLHHLLGDAWSNRLLFLDLSRIYNALLDGYPLPESQETLHYGDYARWQQALLQSDALKNSLTFWQQALSETDNLALPLDYPRPRGVTHRGDFLRIRLHQDDYAALLSLCATEGATLFHGLMSLWQLLLSRICGQENFAVGTPVAGRNHQDTRNLPGFFTNTLAIPADTRHTDSFRTLIGKVKNRSIAAMAHQDVPFEHLIQTLDLPLDQSFSPVFQVFFSFNPEIATQQLTFNGAELTQLHSDTRTAKFDLSLIINQTDEGLDCHFEYNTDVFERATIAGIADCFRYLLSVAATEANTAIANLTLLNAETQQKLLTLGTHPVAPPQTTDIATLIERQSTLTPDKTAIIDGDRRLTFSELNGLANHLAGRLHKTGILKGETVGLYGQLSASYMVTLLATIKAGAAYVPMDPMFPAERLTTIAAQSDMQCILASMVLPEGFRTEASLIPFNLLQAEAETDNPERQLTPDSPLYLLFTSGSTGTPKAAVIHHANEANLLHWYQQTFHMTEKDRVLVFSAPGFDLTQKNLLAPLCYGAELHFTGIAHYDPEVILQTIGDRDITWINCAPGAFEPLLSQPRARERLQSLQQLFLGGEPVDLTAFKPWLDHPDCTTRLVNMYGPTECTDIATAYTYRHEDNEIPMGKPAANVRLLVLDRHGKLLPQGAIGELHIAGDSVGAGYYGDPERTARQFIPNPFSQSEHDRTLYRTGDLVRYNSEGNLVFIARNDQQMKIRGFRVEPVDIESRLKQLPHILDAAVSLQQPKEAGSAQLVAFLVSNHPMASAKSYRQQLKTALADFMIPVAFESIDAIPYNRNGKVDRKQLPDVTLMRAEEQPFVAPRIPMEAELANMWQQLLGVEKVGVLDDFFELGGHSLLATRLLIRIREKFFIDLPMRTLFEVSTIEGLAEIIFAMQNSAEPTCDDSFEEGIL